MSLQGKVFAVTGGASGIGLATAKLLSQRGATVCIADIDPEAIQAANEFFSSSGADFMITKVDVSRRNEVDAWIDGIVGRYSRLDGAANVAVNLTGMMYCLRAELRHIVDRGSIVNTLSIHGLKGFPKHSAYDVSKHGVIGLTKAAAQENGAREVRINAVAPGAIHTPLMKKNWKILGRTQDDPFDDPSAFQRQGSAEELGSVIAFLLGPDSSFVSGSVYSVDGAWN